MLKCVHYWVIDASGEGPTSAGVCIKCEETGDFENTIQERNWDDPSNHRESAEVAKGRAEYFKSGSYTPYPR